MRKKCNPKCNPKLHNLFCVGSESVTPNVTPSVTPTTNLGKNKGSNIEPFKAHLSANQPPFEHHYTHTRKATAQPLKRAYSGLNARY